MLFVKAFHIIAMVAWFAGLFYLPRLFVYHTEAKDAVSVDRFKIMERRLYYGITWPAALLTTLLGLWLLSYNLPYYIKAGWMHAKLCLVVLLWTYHLFCGHYVKVFAQNQNRKSLLFFRIYNEMPTLLLIGIVLLVVVK
ncbi:protoporphyrinogen oxidase HemJ [Legionella sp.]|uniref:protoporphyrinogen oxidase HemJ n=1 Tax=Legionella sp. TaxID=459 RepID=UPI003C904CB5